MKKVFAVDTVVRDHLYAGVAVSVIEQETVPVSAVAALIARQTVYRPRLLRGDFEHDFPSFRSKTDL